MKKKLLVITLCFTLIFSSLSYKKSYADGGVISLPMLATVSALAVGTGLVIKNSDDLYDLGRLFYDYVDKHNDLTWQTVQSVFLSSVALKPNKLVSVDSKFLDIVKGFFDDVTSKAIDGSITQVSGMFEGAIYTLDSKLFNTSSLNSLVLSSLPGKVYYSGKNRSFNKIVVEAKRNYTSINFYFNDTLICYDYVNLSTPYYRIIKSVSNPGMYHLKFNTSEDSSLSDYYNILSYSFAFDYQISFPYTGGYNWDDVESKKENDKVALPIPGNLGTLVGQGSKDFWDNTDNLVGNGDLSLPSVDNPSIGVDSSTTFPTVDLPGVDSPSVPNEGIWSTIKEFIISLVVPKDSFWTDTWGSLYNNFTSSFPMVDMDGFNSLVTGEKKFPNIDINIMGVSGRVVNGDVINSIVDWLRPIVAGFMMLCLMFFNYRKIYKLIRNSEPFGGIAPGNNSDIKTGISEYSKHEVVKATDMVAEYHAWKERGGK